MSTSPTLLRAAAAARLRAERARDDAPAYLELVLADERGVPLRLAEIHRAWIQHVSWCWGHGYHALVLAPFGHGKSSVLSIGLVSYLLGRDPATRIKVVSNDDESSKQRVKAVATIISESPNFRLVFPGCRRAEPPPAASQQERRERQAWTQHAIYLRRPAGAVSPNPSLQARGLFSTGIGGRCDYLVFDDTVDMRNSLGAPELRAKVHATMMGTWMSRLDSGGHALGVGTVWHRQDAWHHLMRNPRWVTLRQWVSADKRAISQEVWNAPPGYPDLGDSLKRKSPVVAVL